MYKICRIYASARADQEDLFQEIMIQLWQSYPSFRGDSKFSTWLYRIALNTAIGGLRKRRPDIRYTDPGLLTSFPETDENHPPETEERSRELYKAISLLTDLEKAIVMLFLENNSYEEMEAILGLKQNNLRVKMNRIKAKLRKMTKTEDDGN